MHVVLVLGDPDDPMMSLNQGYFGLGGIPGAILLMMWPTATSLAKIGHAAAHELHHNVRYANVDWDPMAVTVGEQVVAEGLAEAFVRELAGEDAMGPWATSLSGAELDAACAKIAAGIDVAGMRNLSPYVFGDRTALRLGQEPVGLPDFMRLRGRAALRGRPPRGLRADRRRERRPARARGPRERGRADRRMTRPRDPYSRVRARTPGPGPVTPARGNRSPGCGRLDR